MQEEEFVEHDAAVRRRAERTESLDVGVPLGSVDSAQGLAERQEPETGAYLVRHRIHGVGRPCVHRGMNHPAHRGSGHRRGLRIDRDDPVRRRRVLALVGTFHLRVRDPQADVPAALDPPVHDPPSTRLQPGAEPPDLVEPRKFDGARVIPGDRREDRAPTAASHSSLLDASNLEERGRVLAGRKVAYLGERTTVLVAKRQVVEQVVDRGDLEPLEFGRARRTDSGYDRGRLCHCSQPRLDRARRRIARAARGAPRDDAPRGSSTGVTVCVASRFHHPARSLPRRDRSLPRRDRSLRGRTVRNALRWLAGW